MSEKDAEREFGELVRQALVRSGVQGANVTTGTGQFAVALRGPRTTPEAIMFHAQLHAEKVWGDLESADGDIAPAIEMFVEDRCITIGVPPEMLFQPEILGAFFQNVVLVAVRHVKPDTVMLVSSVWALPQRADPDYDDPAPGVYPMDHPERREGLVVEVMSRHRHIGSFVEILRTENAAPTLAPPWHEAPGTGVGFEIAETIRDN